MTKTYDTVILGGGPSGIASALRMRKKGHQVLLIEKNEKVGGKLDFFEWEGFRWDKGPSLFTLPKLVDELFELFNKNAKDYFDYHSLDENCRYHFPDGTHFIFYKSADKRKQALAEHFNEVEVEAVENYLKHIGKTYQSIGDLFIAAPKRGFKEMLAPDVLKQYPKFLSGQMLFSLNRYNEKMLKHPKLVQLFNRFGTYNGSNPYEMSGLYSMIPHLELNVGTYFPKGGMRAIVDSLARLMKEEGVDVLLNEEEVSLEKTNSGYVTQTSQGPIESENFICAIDHINFYKHVFQDDKMVQKHIKEERSTSAVVFYWAVKGDFPQVGLHNILFSANYKEEFDHLFHLKKFYKDPTIYIHNSSAVEKKDAPENGQNWFVMINAPAGVQPTEEELSNLRETMKARIQKHLGIDLSGKILHEERWDMERIEQKTGSFTGSLYGAAFNSKTASFTRHGNKSKKYPNMYFVGGSVHPGGGIPLVLKSAKIVDELIG